MTLYEYRIRREAQRLIEADTERAMHWQAWLNLNVQGVKEGQRFSDFFDYETILNGQKKNKVSSQSERIARAMKAQREGRNPHDGKL